MKWCFRWYGKDDLPNIPLNYVRQIPGVTGVVGTLLNKSPGDLWRIEDIMQLKDMVENNNLGLKLYGIESVSIHDSIKAGTSERDKYIDIYTQSIRNLAKCGVNLICYSFKPIFGWAKTDMNYENTDTSTTLLYDESVIQSIEPAQMYQLVTSQTGDFDLSGWEPERFDRFDELLAMYDGMTEDDLADNLQYFLERIIPVCEEVGVYMAIHPDDPPWDMFGLPRITKDLSDLKRILNMVDSPHNGLTFCCGSLGASPHNDIPAMIREVGDRIHFVHFRNIEHIGDKKFRESAHPSLDGSLDMYEIMEALVDVGFNGLIRPDHGRNIWGETPRPGYGLYDRALGISYGVGLEEAVKKSKNIPYDK